MNHFNIKRRVVTKKRKLRLLNLHERVVLFSLRNKDIANHLLAVKWIGNTGSHVGDVTRDDVFDDFQIINYVLDELFLKRSEVVSKLTKQINKAKKPRSAKRTRAKADDLPDNLPF